MVSAAQSPKKRQKSSRLLPVMRFWGSQHARLATVVVVCFAIVCVVYWRQSGRAAVTYQDRAGFAATSSMMLWPQSDVDLGRDMDLMAATGAKWIRFDIDWQSVETSKGSYNWSHVDRVITAATVRGFQVIGTIAYTPAWARPGTTSDKYPPANLDDYADFARAVVQRYSSKGVKHWEIWNEPNLKRFWEPGPNPQKYTDMLLRAYTAIKAADPNAFVITGGLAPAADGGENMDEATYVRGIYAAGGKGFFDAIGHHPYNFPDSPIIQHPDSAFMGATPAIRNVMVANGDTAKKIWGTEYGVPTHGDGGVTDARQGEWITLGYDYWFRWDYTGPLLWYTHRDMGNDKANREHNFGLVRNDFSLKPAYGVFKQVVGGPIATAAPDLMVTSIAVTPASPVAGQAVTFTATIKNQGTAATPSGVIHGIGFRINGGVTVAWSDTSMESLAAGASRTLTANSGPNGMGTWTPVSAGTYTVDVTVDDVNRITNELNESNNLLSKTFSVTAAPSAKPGDANNDSTVNALDLSLVLSNYGRTSATLAQGDVNTDGSVNGLDLSLVLTNYGK